MIISIRHYRDADGNKLAQVPLTNSPKHVTLFEDDLRSLDDRGIPLTWKLTTLNVVVICGKRSKDKSVARLIMEANEKDRIRLKDKDPCNLRRDNILMTTSRAIANDYVINHIFE